jgi:DNA polymerase III subunit gamma/tau
MQTREGENYNYDFLSSESLPGIKPGPQKEEKAEFKLVKRGDGPFREKYRPQRINEVVPTCSKEQLLSIIRNPQASQIYLLEGRTGTGKTTCARVLAKAYVCQDTQDENKPCLVCEACEAFEKSYDVYEINGADKNKVEDARSWAEDFRYSPSVFRYKIYIIDEIQRLTDAAQQVLLTELEEPPPYLLVFMCTTDSKQLAKPLADRATRVTFADLKASHAGTIIKQICSLEGISVSEDIIDSLYQQSKGSIRALLNNIQTCAAGGFDPENWEEDEAPAEIVSLFKLITKGLWQELAKSLAKPNIRSEPETIRMSLENYFRGVILRCSSLDEAHRLGEAMVRLSGSLFSETSTCQYNQFVLKCLRACYVFRSN